MNGNGTLFVERYAAAQSMKNFWTRLASTYGCIMIVLSQQTLTIKPHWFANWVIRLLRLDLCHEVPSTKIRDITQVGKWFNYGKVEVHFETVKGEHRKILLYLKRYREFIDRATQAIRQ